MADERKDVKSGEYVINSGVENSGWRFGAFWFNLIMASSIDEELQLCRFVMQVSINVVFSIPWLIPRLYLLYG